MKVELNDIFRFLSIISFSKLLNSIKLHLSYLLSVIYKKPIIIAKPESISIEPINLCNLQCPECPTGTNSLKRKKGAIDFSLYKQIIDDGKKYLLSIILYFQGEPFLNKEIFKQIKYAKKKKIYTITSTNGHFLDSKNSSKIIDSGLDRLLISLDGTNQETYEKYRIGGDFNKVITGINTLVKAKEEKKSLHPKIILQFLVFKHNQNQIADIKKLAKELKVDKLEIKTAQIINNFELNTEIEKYSRYKVSGESLKIKSNLPNYCKRMWNSVVITVDGNISPCCFDKDSNNKYGNYSDIKFTEIRKSIPYRKFSNNILQNRKSIDICKNCTEGIKV